MCLSLAGSEQQKAVAQRDFHQVAVGYKRHLGVLFFGQDGVYQSLCHLKYLLQAHICPVKEDHPIGFDCLSDEQTMHILMFMDPDSLMNFSRFPITFPINIVSKLNQSLAE